MVRKTRFPDAVDVREIVTPQKVAAVAGVTAEIAQVVVDAHIFGIRSMVASGATIVRLTGDAWEPPYNAAGKYITQNLRRLFKGVIAGDELAALVAKGMPIGSPVPRYDPALEDELLPLTEWLTQCRIPEITTSDVEATLNAWWDLERELVEQVEDGAITVEVVLRRGWDASEREFEDWLELNLAKALGSNLTLIKRQWRAPFGGIADLLVKIDPVDDPTDDPYQVLQWFTNKETGIALALQKTGSNTPGMRRDVYCDERVLSDPLYPREMLDRVCKAMEAHGGSVQYVVPANFRQAEVDQVAKTHLDAFMSNDATPNPATMRAFHTELQAVLDRPRS